MKNIALFLLIIFINSCSPKKNCNLKFEQYLNSNFLKLWDEQTINKMKEMDSKKAIILLDFEKRHKGAIFDRSDFLQTVENNYKLNDNRFGEFSIFEIKYTGEKNQNIKYLIGSCGDESIVVKYGQGINGWIVSSEYKINTEKVEHLYKVLLEKDKQEYWGSSITEVGCLTRIKGVSQVSVQVIESLSKLQFDALIGLQSRD
jgi:hypothetical protein